jgi:hypothetical protein
LEQIPELANNFKIPTEKASPIIEDGYKTYTQTIRADNDKVSQIPSIPLAYFDADEGEYVVARTEPIKLQVTPTRILTNTDLEGLDFAPVNKEVEAIKKGLSANYEDLDALTNQTFSLPTAATSPGYVAIWAGPFALLVFSALIKFLTHKTPEKIAMRRRRTAASHAIGQLKRIGSLEGQQQHEKLASVMKQFLGDRFDKTAGSLTSDDCFEIISKATQNNELARRYREIIAGCEAARYASGTSDVNVAQVNEVMRLIRTIEKKCKKR